MSLTENSNQVFLHGGATLLKILDSAPRPTDLNSNKPLSEG